MKSENCEHQLSFILKVGKNEIWRMEITPPNYSISPFSALRKILCKKKSNQTLPVNRADQGILLLIALFPEWERGMRASA